MAARTRTGPITQTGPARVVRGDRAAGVRIIVCDVRSASGPIAGRSPELPAVMPGGGEVEHAGLEGRRDGELQRHLAAGLGEQPLAAAGHDREGEPAQFVGVGGPGAAS